MKAVGLDYSRRRLCIRDVAEPEPRADQVLLEVVEVGVCGTDRELAHFHLGYPPEGEEFLTLGHEALARVAAAGSKVQGFQRGDWVAPAVRRSCRPACVSCARGRRDLCVSGNWHDRGVTGEHGYFTRYAVDSPEDLVLVPPSLADRAVLMEPLSVVEKAAATALRLHEPGARKALVLGAGPIGILSALVFQKRGLEVTIASLEEEAAPRVRLIRRAGVGYRQGTGQLEQADIVVEATGSSQVAAAGLGFLAPLGVYALIGGSNASGDFPFRQMVLKNQMVFGSVNASPEAFKDGLNDLAAFDGAVVDGLLHRLAFNDFERSILAPPGEAVKLVHRIAG